MPQPQGRGDRVRPEGFVERAVVPAIEPDADRARGIIQPPGDELSLARHDVDLIAGAGWPTTRSIDESKTQGWRAKNGVRGAA